MILIADTLKAQGVEIKLVEFARYADARTALLAGSLDVASVGPADLAISLANGSTSMVGIMGVGASPKYVIAGKDKKFDSWDDIKGKKIAIAPGSAVWFQFAATLVEKGIPYSSFNAVNIQGGGANFNTALEKGEVDAIVTWEPFESIPVMKATASSPRTSITRPRRRSARNSACSRPTRQPPRPSARRWSGSWRPMWPR